MTNAHFIARTTETQYVLFKYSPTVTAVDSDQDGLPDAYEAITPGLSATNPLDAALDFDGDGSSNLQEFVAGTNPNVASSRPFASGVISGANFLVSVSTVAGRFYRVERSQTLVGAWTPVMINVAGTGGVEQLSVPVSSSNPRQFFRATVAD